MRKRISGLVYVFCLFTGGIYLQMNINKIAEKNNGNNIKQTSIP
jgi:hypothetical protein